MRKHKKNFKFLENFSYFVPGGGQIVVLILLFICGSLVGSGLVALISLLSSIPITTEYATLISYPVSFIPAMTYASVASHRNELFDPEFPLDRNRFAPYCGTLLATLAVFATLSASLMTDLINFAMPEMPQWLRSALEQLTGGNFWINLICVSVFAPFFEEWLCRGMFLRGLLNHRRNDGSRGIKPVWAIVISAALFALIHFNPWQAIPAFVIGLLMGYVYYRTGSLKLTILMHCANNTIALVLGHIDRFKDAQNWIDVMGPRLYGIAFTACGLFILLTLRLFSRIDGADGSSDK